MWQFFMEIKTHGTHIFPEKLRIRRVGPKNDGSGLRFVSNIEHRAFLVTSKEFTDLRIFHYFKFEDSSVGVYIDKISN